MMIRIQRQATLVTFALLSSAVIAQDFLVFTAPTFAPTTAVPTAVPTTAVPTANPTTAAPTTAFPTEVPSESPSHVPSNGPSDMPSDIPSGSPSDVPSFVPTESASPSSLPSFLPTIGPTSSPTLGPTTASPTDRPTFPVTPSPSSRPSSAPTSGPTSPPTTTPTIDPDTVAGFIINNPDLALLSTAYRRAGFVEPLSSPGTFTVFAPLDTAFSVVPAVYMALFFENDSFIPHLRKLLLHNILPAKRLAAEFIGSTNATALSGENFLVLQNPTRVNGILIDEADIEVSNGVVHVIDDVLAPTWVFASLQSRIVGNADLSTLFSLMNLIGLNIGNLGEYTFLAPTNDAFVTLGEETMAILTDTDNTSLLGKFLLYHILPGVHTLPELLPSRLETFEGGVVTVAVNPGRFNGVTVAEGDVLANNGVLHKINNVLFYENGVKGDTALDFVADDPDLSTFFGALQRSGFDTPLSQSSSLTIFAPTNNAFNAVPTSLRQTLFYNNEFVPHLQNLILYHILGGEVFSSGFANGTVINALNQRQVGIRTDPLAVNGFPMLSVDNDVSNGVVHTLGGVLLPSWVFTSITHLVVASSGLSTLSSLLVLAEIDISGAGAVTLLAPTNNAFTAMQQGNLQALTNPDNVDLRLAFLAKHVVPGVYTKLRLKAGLELPTIRGDAVVTVTSINPVLLDGVASFVFSDALSSNGVIHAIDTVLDPEA
jgi:transforming growth factor-beta-induced protein